MPPDLHVDEEWALRRLAPGPGNWIRPVDLRHLSHKYSFPFSFASFEHSALATKLRVLHFERSLQLETRYSELNMLLATSQSYPSAWEGWYEQSHVFVLHRARIAASRLGIISQTIIASIRSETSRAIEIKKKFQSRALRHILHKEPYNQEHYLREKLAKWKIDGVSAFGLHLGWLAPRALRCLTHAFELVQPRVAIVLFRTWGNAWCTASRFQNHDVPCLFGCGSRFKEDCIKHYAFCPIVKAFAREALDIPPQLIGNMRGFMCLDSDIPDSIRTVQLLLLFAIYSATNCLRFSAPHNTVNNNKELLWQFVHQGTFNHSASQAVVSNLSHRFRNVRRRIN